MKKDPNYIAAVEKAISEKYGTQAAHNLKSNWTPEKEKEYLEQLKETTRSNSAKKKRPPVSTDRTCPVCKTYSFSIRDDIYMNRFKCCYDCYIDFAKSHPERWSNGWRPPQEEIKKFLLLRRRNNG